jgi:hypothetical protein
MIYVDFSLEKMKIDQKIHTNKKHKHKRVMFILPNSKYIQIALQINLKNGLDPNQTL